MPKKFLPTFVWMLCQLFIPFVDGQEPRGAKPPQLRELFRDDFAEDTLDDYQLKGEVTWRNGTLQIAPDASISRDISGGAWARVSFKLSPQQVPVDQSKELRVWFILEGTTPCYVRIRDSSNELSTCSIALVDLGEKNGEPIEVVVRVVEVPTGMTYLVEYRFGNVEVWADDKPCFNAYKTSGSAAVTACRISSQDKVINLASLSLYAAQSPHVMSTEDQKKSADTDSKRNEGIRLFKQGRLEESLRIAIEVAEVNKNVHGPYSNEYATSLCSLAFLCDSMNDKVRAETLYLEAIQIQEKVLGQEHPVYAQSLSNLGLLCFSVGDNTRAEPLLLEAKVIQEKVFGKENTDYANRLHNLATLYISRHDRAQAEPLFLEIVEILGKALGKQHPDYATSLHNLATLYDSMGDKVRAEHLHLAAKQIREIAIGKQHPAYLQSVRDLGLLYFSMKDAARAEPLLLEAKEIQEKSFGKENTDYANLLHQLAVLYISRGEKPRAEPLLLEVKEILEKALGKQHPDYATSLYNLASFYDSMGNTARAASLLQEAKEIRGKVLGKEHPDYAIILHNLALLYISRGGRERAEPLCIEAKEIREKLLGKEHADYAQSLNDLALLYISMGDAARARPCLSEAIAIQEKILGKEHPDYALSLHNLAELYKASGDKAQAEQLYLEANGILEKVLGKEHSHYATSATGLASLYFSIGDIARAEKLYVEAREIFEKVLGKEHPTYANSLNNLAQLYISIGDTTLAIPLYLEARKIQKQVLGEEHPDFASNLSNLAAVYDSIGDKASAEPLYVEAKEIFEKVLGREHPQYARNISNLARLYYANGDTASAEPLLLEAKETLSKALGMEHPDYATCLTSLASLYLSIGDTVRAEKLFLEVKEIRERVLGKQHPDYAGSLNNLAHMYAFLGDTAHAEPMHLEAKDIIETVLGKQHPSYASCLSNLAILYNSMGDTARALPVFLEAKMIREEVLGQEHPDYARSLNNLAHLYLSIGDTSHAEPLLLEAKEVLGRVLGKEHLDYATCLNNLASVCVTSDRVSEAIPLFEKALSIASLQLDSAALGLSERQQLAMGQSRRLYLDNYVSACLQSPSVHLQGAKIAVLWKGSVLHRLRQLRKAADDPAIAEQFTKLQRVVAHLSKVTQSVPDAKQFESWKDQVARLTAEKEALESELVRTSASYRKAIEQITFEQIQQAIPQDAVLVDYLEYTFRDEKHLMASIVKSNAPPTMIALGSAIEAGQSIDLWRESFGVSSAGQEAGLKLRRQIWEPLLAHIGDSQTVLVSTDGVLGKMPLAALPGKQPDSYLIEDHRLSLVPVPQLLPNLVNEQDRKQVKHELLLMGDVDYDSVAPTQLDATAALAVRGEPTMLLRGDQHWSPLSETEAEVALIADKYKTIYKPGPDAIVDLRKSVATETAFRNFAPQSVYLHLATHGFFAAPDKKPMRSGERSGMIFESRDTGIGFSPGQLSGLVFAGANRHALAASAATGDSTLDDGIMTSDEIAFLRLEGVRLAVLSACETGLGEAAGGEGLLGIQRSFQLAGARSTVASLWKVNDAATRRIMEEFYTNLFERKLSMLEALRRAQIWALHHPSDVPLGDSTQPRAAPVVLPNVKVVDAVKGPRLSPQYWAPFVLSGDWR